MATRNESRAYVAGLLEKKGNNTINDAEKNALKTYIERHVGDTEGGLSVEVDPRRIRGHEVGSWFPGERYPGGYPTFGALFVRASSESK